MAHADFHGKLSDALSRLHNASGEPRVLDLTAIRRRGWREVWRYRVGSDGCLHVDDRSALYLYRYSSDSPVCVHHYQRELAALVQASVGSVPVPRVVRYCDDQSFLDGPFLIVEGLPGCALDESQTRRASMGSSLVSPAEVGELLGQIHLLPVVRLPPEGDSHSVESQLDALAVAVNMGFESPILRLAVNWLRDNLPPLREPARFVHGDFRLGNLLVNDGRVSGVVDWVGAHRGDYHEDIAKLWGPVIRNPDILPFVGDGSEFVAAYEATTKLEVNQSRLLWWRLLTNVKWSAWSMARTCRLLAQVERSQRGYLVRKNRLPFDESTAALMEQVLGK